MEFIVVCIIILVCCMILGVSLNYILYTVFGVVLLLSLFFTLFFVFCIVCLLFSKRKEARFVRFDKLRDSKYQVAYYLVEGSEYPCVFPKEGIFSNKLYQQDRVYYVFLNKKLEKVLDRFATITCILGLVFWSILSVSLLILIL